MPNSVVFIKKLSLQETATESVELIRNAKYRPILSFCHHLTSFFHLAFVFLVTGVLFPVCLIMKPGLFDLHC